MISRHRDFKKSLRFALVIPTIFLLGELAGGLMTGSLALVSDAGHMFSNVLALLLSLGAITLASRLPIKERTMDSIRQGFCCVRQFPAAYCRKAGNPVGSIPQVTEPCTNPERIMGAVAVFGLISNVVVAFLLNGSHKLNVRSASLYVFGDTVSSVAVIAAALWISITGQVIADLLLSGFIAVIILVSATRILRKTNAIPIHLNPRTVYFDAVVADMTSVRDVAGVHHVHLWSLSSDIHLLDATSIAASGKQLLLKR